MKNYIFTFLMVFVFFACKSDDFSANISAIENLNKEIASYQSYLLGLKNDSVAQSFKAAQEYGRLIQAQLDDEKAADNKKAVMFLDQNLCILRTLPKFDAKGNGLNRDLDTLQSRLQKLKQDIESKAVYAYDTIADQRKISMPDLVASFIEEERLLFEQKKSKFQKRITALENCSDAFYAQKDSIDYYLNKISN